MGEALHSTPISSTAPVHSTSARVAHQEPIRTNQPKIEAPSTKATARTRSPAIDNRSEALQVLIIGESS